MSGADEAEANWPRVGTYLSSTAGEPIDSAAVNAETQLIPLVDAEKVRAVARRAPAALPALGSDGPRDVPGSAKTTVERRRRAQGRELAEPAPNETEPSASPSSDLAPVALLGQPEPSVSKHAASDPAITPAAPAVSETSEASAEDFTGPTVLVPALTPEVLSTAGAAAKPKDAPAWPVATPTEADASAVEDALPVRSPGATSPASADTLLAVTETLPKITAGTPPAEGPADPPVRPGPPVLHEDSWDVPPDRDPGNDLYQGRRRAGAGRARLLLILALLAVVGAIFLVPLAFNRSSAPGAAATGGSAVTDGSAVEPGATDDSGVLVSAASSPGAKAIGPAGKSPVAGGQPSGPAASAPTSTVPRQTTPPPQAQPPSTFATFTLQAESAALSASSWQIDKNPSCTAGTWVVRTGKWSESPPGSVTFTVTVAAAGSYKVTIFSVVSSGTRRAEITVNGASVTSPDFPEGCMAARSLVVSLNQGNNQIRFTNQNSRGPSIDRIDIGKP